jgi:hypothetical protein
MRLFLSAEDTQRWNLGKLCKQSAHHPPAPFTWSINENVEHLNGGIFFLGQ